MRLHFHLAFPHCGGKTSLVVLYGTVGALWVSGNDASALKLYLMHESSDKGFVGSIADFFSACL